MRRQHTTSGLILVLILGVLCTAEKCSQDDVRKQIRKWNTKAAKALVQADDTWKAYYQTETDRIGDEILAKHAGETDWSEADALAEFEAATADLQKADARYQASKMAIKHGLDANEQILDAWVHGESKAVAACITDITHALYDLVELFLATGLKIPNLVQTVIAGGENLMEVLHSPDFTDPMDD